MKKLSYKGSQSVSIGVELEFQIIDPNNFDLTARSKDLIRRLKNSTYQKRITPEITQSMIEINSSVHISPQDMYEEFLDIHSFLLKQASDLNIYFAGGGTHPFQKWTLRKIFPIRRYKDSSKQYRYLSKRATVFGQHIHVGCPSGDDAIYLTHAMARYVPQLIAMSASSPFYQGIDTGYHSCRLNVFSAFPTSGVMPYLKNWKEFSIYYHKMRNLGVIGSMKDLYWDIRPKPNYGTVELRVCDTPLTIKKTIWFAAYLQALCYYLLKEKPDFLNHDLYFLYNYNRFQACRYGYEGDFINPVTLEHCSIQQDILDIMDKIHEYVSYFKNNGFIEELKKEVLLKQNDTELLRQIQREVHSFPLVVEQQCKWWAES